METEKKKLTKDKSWRDVIVKDTTKIVGYQTWRDGSPQRKKIVLANLEEIKKFFTGKMTEFNQEKPKTPMEFFEWQDKKTDPDYWVFGFRAGKGSRKISLICHLDTVPPGSDDWKPFEAREETRIYNGVPTDFLIGRGAIDDKGPAVVAFESFRRALEQANASDEAIQKLQQDLTLEVLFDTSEETDMSTPKYFEKNPGVEPELGIVFDAYWSVRAEKGIERPVFTVSSDDVGPAPEDKLYIAQLKSSEGSANMIPVTAEAHITGNYKTPEKLQEKLKDFYGKINAWYLSCLFDDPDYHPAEISVTITAAEVVIKTKVSGAQHGSQPHQNRANGANPVVSLTNFLAILIERGILANNHNGEMCRFIRWAFGTRAFGENHPDLLYRFDTVFAEGNGTTYGLTQLFNPDNDPKKISLGIDVRYATGHHGAGWDGREGQLKGDSVFQFVFQQLVDSYKTEADGARVTFARNLTEYGPDIRSLRNDHLFKINMAYRSIMGENCPMRATGGATDAHGYLNLVTAGALFTDNFGPPVNYHGLDEGAPLPDLENSGKILLNILLQELGASETQATSLHGIHHCHGCCN